MSAQALAEPTSLGAGEPDTARSRRIRDWVRRLYAQRGPGAVLGVARAAIVSALVVLLGTAMWGIGLLDERGLLTEDQDALLTVGAITLVALIGVRASGRIVSPLVELQETKLRQALEEERRTREVLERELAARQAFIEQANHHLRTPVTVIYGLTHFLADRGDQVDDAQRAELRHVVLENAGELKAIVEDLSEFLDARMSEIS